MGKVLKAGGVGVLALMIFAAVIETNMERAVRPAAILMGWDLTGGPADIGRAAVSAVVGELK